MRLKTSSQRMPLPVMEDSNDANTRRGARPPWWHETLTQAVGQASREPGLDRHLKAAGCLMTADNDTIIGIQAARTRSVLELGRTLVPRAGRHPIQEGPEFPRHPPREWGSRAQLVCKKPENSSLSIWNAQ